ncbi:hypothetical protein A2U01_0085114, partial [Trifolium medium]|nr:hypothetical protein [Trifolium medium]
MDPHNNTWDEDTINQHFYPIEASMICQIPLAHTMEEDTISWQGTHDGNYTVKSGYNAIMEWQCAKPNQAQSSHFLAD